MSVAGEEGLGLVKGPGRVVNGFRVHVVRRNETAKFLQVKPDIHFESIFV